jgi:hypothetical protein
LPYPPAMVQTTAEARRQLADSLAEATEALGSGLASLGAAYEQLDEHSADRLEESLFRPTQLAFGRASRIHASFAARHGLAPHVFELPSPGLPSTGAKGFIDNAVAAVAKADAVLSELQDSMLPAEVGDAELRAALANVRELLGGVRQRARELERTLGR